MHTLKLQTSSVIYSSQRNKGEMLRYYATKTTSTEGLISEHVQQINIHIKYLGKTLEIRAKLRSIKKKKKTDFFFFPWKLNNKGTIKLS